MFCAYFIYRVRTYVVQDVVIKEVALCESSIHFEWEPCCSLWNLSGINKKEKSRKRNVSSMFL